MVLFIQYLLTTLIAYLGLVVGTFISKLASEELPVGNKFFEIAKNGLFALVIAAILINLHISLPIIIGFIIFFSLHFIKIKAKYLYLITSLPLVLSAKSESLFIIEAVLIFLLGSVISALTYNTKKPLLKNIREIVIKNLLFLAVAIVLFFILY